MRFISGDSLSYHNNQQFSTKERDNDGARGNCANTYLGGWWYRSCYDANLNGKYFRNGWGYYHIGNVIWLHWKHYRHALKAVKMKIRPSRTY